MQLDHWQAMVPVAGLLTNSLFQVLGFRYLVKRNLVKSVVMGYFFGLASVFVYEYHLGIHPTGSVEYWCILIANIITYSGLAYCYFAIIGLGVSLRIRLLDIVSHHPDGLLQEEIGEKFAAEVLIERRIQRLVENGQIREEDGRLYAINSPFLLLARLNAAVKKFMTGKSSEFD
jgi:hypothetical protein